MDTLSDKELVALVRGGDTSAFNVLSDRYMPLLQNRAGRYANIVGVDVEDFVQEGLFALFRAAKGYDPDAQAQFITYATTCINNSMADAIRAHMKNARQSSHLRIDDLDEHHFTAPSLHTSGSVVEDILIDQEDSECRARQMNAKLSEFEQQVLQHYLKGHSYTQISQELSTATKAVDNALQRVRRKLRPDV